MLEANNLEVVYDDVVLVLRGVSLKVPEGRVVALLGANGAGKTTLLRALSGLLGVHEGKVTRGRVTLDGEPIHRASPSRIAALGVKQALEGRRVLAQLTVEENLRVGGHTAPRAVKRNLERMYELFPRLRERRGQSAGYLSGGEQQMLSIGRALMSEPRYLLLDEPSLGLAPLVVQQIRDLVVKINADGTTVLLVEQNATMALSIADHGYVLETGKVVMDSPAVALLADEDVREFYLGLGGEGAARSFRDVKHYKRRKRWLS
ncbi:ABC transporter ATP-binding protein [Saccharothrix xinjiangensis]|uniref:ABC transporter ATP-binding protein n=1 Tax=Saccharothrix xinjiangensis TaxID=204798 RepID=A0ABV9YDY4_9PSEU